MRAQIDRVVLTLCAGRTRRDVFASLMQAMGCTCVLCLSAYVFLLMEPGA